MASIRSTRRSVHIGILYDELIELRVNIRVFRRCQPQSANEISSVCSPVVEVDPPRETDLQYVSSERDEGLNLIMFLGLLMIKVVPYTIIYEEEAKELGRDFYSFTRLRILKSRRIGHAIYFPNYVFCVGNIHSCCSVRNRPSRLGMMYITWILQIYFSCYHV